MEEVNKANEEKHTDVTPVVKEVVYQDCDGNYRYGTPWTGRDDWGDNYA